MTSLRTALRPAMAILVGASLMLSLAMGLRQSLGIFMPSLTRDLGISVSDFTLAIAVSNLVWGVLQPVVGAWSVRFGFRPLVLGGAVAYLLGLVLMATAHGGLAIMVGAGFLIGSAMACVGPALAMAMAARAVPVGVRSTVLGIVSGAGSLGALISAPLGQLLMQAHGWRAGLWGFVVLAILMLPAAWYAARSDRIVVPPSPGADDRAAAVLGRAGRNLPFVVMSLAYFVCGMQLVFLSTHLPSYLEICGMDPMLSAEALGTIGGFNVLGSLFFGWAGQRWNKLVLLGGIYVMRSATLALYFTFPPTPVTTLVFAAIMGFLWLGVGPLVAGWIADTFGLRWQAMLGGVAFVSHQVGSFVGAFGGGLIYDAMGSYTMAWQIGVGLGVAAGIVQILVVLHRDARPPLPMPA